MAQTLEEKRAKKRAYNKKYYAENRNEILTYQHDYYCEHTDEILAKKQNRYYDNWENIRADQAEYYKDNKEDLQAKHKEYRNTLHGRAVQLLGAYNQADRNRGMPCGGLTVEQVEELIQQPCAHCGKVGWDVIGLNRLDNSKPHTKDNVEPCCQSCNSTQRNIEYWAKKKRPIEE